MKKNRIFGLPALLLILGLVLAGCPTDAADGGGAKQEDPQAAQQLAADINAFEEGDEIATVDDATVTLVGKAVVPSAGNLTVPAGVTLEVTADGAELTLRDATLTVNGTVNAGPERVRLAGDASEATIKGSGTIQLKGTGHLLVVQAVNNDNPNRTLTLEGVTLVGVADNNDPLVVARSGGDGRTGHFIMKSGKITGNTHIRIGSEENNNWAGAGGVRVNEGGTFTMEDGVISGNTAKGRRGSGGGGVRVEQDGTFIMQGGVIYGNTAESDDWSEGGGVGVWRGTFTMEDGVISGNTVKGGRGGNGGGVDIGEESMFTLKGGTIYGDVYGLPDGADQSLVNIVRSGYAALHVNDNATAANWGTGGTYTKGGVSQTSGSKIVPFSNNEDDRYDGGTSDTLIATPAK